MATQIELAAMASKRYQWIEQVRTIPLDAVEYCKKWVPILYGKQPEDRGYKAACDLELARVTGLSKHTIERSWGKDFQDAPNYLPRLLRMADLLNHVAKGWELPEPPQEK